jgi:hypothetical protein
LYAEFRGSFVVSGICLLDAVLVFGEWKLLIINVLIRAIPKQLGQFREAKYRKEIWKVGFEVSSTLKMEAICSSETSVDTQRTTRRHIAEDDTPDMESICNLVQLAAFQSRVK